MELNGFNRRKNNDKTRTYEMGGINPSDGISSDIKWKKAMSRLDSMLNSDDDISMEDLMKLIKFLDNNHDSKPLSTLKDVCHTMGNSARDVLSKMSRSDARSMSEIGLDLEDVVGLDNTMRINNVYKHMHERNAFLRILKLVMHDMNSIKDVISKAFAEEKIDADKSVIKQMYKLGLIVEDDGSSKSLSGFSKRVPTDNRRRDDDDNDSNDTYDNRSKFDIIDKSPKRRNKFNFDDDDDFDFGGFFSKDNRSNKSNKFNFNGSGTTRKSNKFNFNSNDDDYNDNRNNRSSSNPFAGKKPHNNFR